MRLHYCFSAYRVTVDAAESGHALRSLNEFRLLYNRSRKHRWAQHLLKGGANSKKGAKGGGALLILQPLLRSDES